ncbi:DUF47 domain-containing protein [Aestuariispira ectoiniformans]|uniref:DUF47 domain-containing protein n=1 Tax=Aestuariispira ectoiniformans TaxID=2775080 RepID=UPI00223A840C|nr:DUF47 family protein [Aestuariispira ectoiniformans]
MNENRPDILGAKPSRVSLLLNSLFPRMADFHGLLNDQCDLVVEAMEIFVNYMAEGDTALALEIRDLEHRGDKLKLRNIDILNRSFSTPFDREDIYRAITAIDEVLNYAKTTVREMEILDVTPDAHTQEMARILCQGAIELQAGFVKLKSPPADADLHANSVRKSERRTEKVYRKAIAELFDPEHYLRSRIEQNKEGDEDLAKLLEPMDPNRSMAVARGLSFVMEALKRREVYRHLSNAADHLAHAGDILHDIVVKAA